jgi:CelD/BcsL family acetyltransferase involved in cellulose biosynthesis
VHDGARVNHIASAVFIASRGMLSDLPRWRGADLLEVCLEKSFNFLSREYHALFRRSCASAFQHPLWLDLLYRRLGPELNAEPMVITARESGALKMVLPLFRRRYGPLRIVEFADLQVSDYASAICDEDSHKTIATNPAFSRSLKQALGGYDLLWIRKMPQDALPIGEIRSLGSLVPMQMNAHAIPLGSSYPEWRMQNMNPSYRRKLDRKEARLNRRGSVKFECVTGKDQIEAAFDRMKAYRQLRFDPECELLQLRPYFEFYLNAAVDGAPSGFARTYILSLDGVTVACGFGIAHGNRFLLLLPGFDLQFRNLSIGALMFQKIARDCIDRGDAVLDCTIGDEPYKGLFGAMPSAMWSLSHARSPLGLAAKFGARYLPFLKRAANNAMRRQLGRYESPS